MKNKFAALGATVVMAIVLVALDSSSAHAQVSTFTASTAFQFYTVPAGVGALVVDVYGAQGGSDGGGGGTGVGPGGKGGRTYATFAVTPGDQFILGVGHRGATSAGNGGAGGFGAGDSGNGGAGGPGDCTSSEFHREGGGGGAPSFAGKYVSGALDTAYLLFAGGGGGGAATGTGGAGGGGTNKAGDGSIPTIATATAGIGAGGATTTGPGAAGLGPDSVGSANATAGSGKNGGRGGALIGSPSGGGGGGGGYFGGGGGAPSNTSTDCVDGGEGGSGGGGSGYVSSQATNLVAENGVQSGDGLIVITTLPPQATTTTTAKPTIKVKAPNGGESYAASGSVPITWTFTNAAPSATVKILLFENGTKQYVIANAAPIGAAGQGSYNAAAPPPGPGYKIKLQINATNAHDFSDRFFSVT